MCNATSCFSQYGILEIIDGDVIEFVVNSVSSLLPSLVPTAMNNNSTASYDRNLLDVLKNV